MNLELKTALGVIVLLVTACLDALGYNIQRRDHRKNNSSLKPRHECTRKYWHLGLYVYLGSLLIGVNIGLQLINAHCVAPLTTSSLIFNLIFARYLVGTSITRRDLIGTAIVIFAILSLLTITILAPIREDTKEIDIPSLKELFNCTTFLVCFVLLNITLVGGITVYFFLLALATKRDDQVLKRNLAIVISVLGGLCGSETIIFATSGATIIQSMWYTKSISLDGFSVGILSGVFLTGAFQLFCLNAGLKLADSVLVGPIFSSVYNVFALFNTLVFLKKYELYHAWALLLMTLAIFVLVLGIVILSRQLKPDPDILPSLPRMKFTKKKTNSEPHPNSHDNLCAVLTPRHSNSG